MPSKAYEGSERPPASPESGNRRQRAEPGTSTRSDLVLLSQQLRKRYPHNQAGAEGDLPRPIDHVLPPGAICFRLSKSRIGPDQPVCWDRVRESSCLTSGVAYPTLWKHEKGSGNRFRRACCPGSHLRRTPAESPGFQHPTRVPSIVTIIIGQEPTYPLPKTLLRHEFSRTVQTRSLRSRRSVGFIIGISAKQHSFANRPGSDNRRRSSG